jgi:hypothetical protein
MRALFVHGMGRSPLSGWRLLSRLEREGISPDTFAYSATFESVAKIQTRLTSRITALANEDEYVLIGHSLGGVLLRCAVNELASETRPPRRLFLIGSPMRAPQLARRVRDHAIYRIITRDCGQLLGSPQRMLAIKALSIPTTCIAGIRGLAATGRAFAGAPNDGVLAISEVTAEWICEHHQVNAIHTLLPTSAEVIRIIVQRMAADAP